MSVRIMVGHEHQGDGWHDKVVLFDAVTGLAFGPVLTDDPTVVITPLEVLESFLAQCTKIGRDPRQVGGVELRSMIARHRRELLDAATAHQQSAR